MPAASKDQYANVLTESVTCSAANTLTFEEVNVGLSLFDKAGILISRVEYEPSGSSVAEMTAAVDSITMAITSSNSLSSLTATQQAVIHRLTIIRHDFGTAASGGLMYKPYVVDFSTLPGSGLLITPKPWYIAIDSGGLASAATGTVRFYFTVIKLSSEQYFELLETRTYFG